jgi:hypothetical protein
VDGEWTRDGLGMDRRWTGQGVEGLEVDSTRTPWTTGGLHRDSTRISGGVINTARTDTILPYPITGNMPASNFNIL